MVFSVSLKQNRFYSSEYLYCVHIFDKGLYEFIYKHLYCFNVLSLNGVVLILILNTHLNPLVLISDLLQCEFLFSFVEYNIVWKYLFCK